MTFNFDSLSPDPRDVQAPEGSINAQLLALPSQRTRGGAMRGRVWVLPRTGLVVTPVDNGKDSGAIVLDGSNGPRKENGAEMYPSGGYDLSVSELEWTTAVEWSPLDAFAFVVDLPEPGEWHHCSPGLLESGYACGTGLRRPCQCESGGSHDHWVSA